MKPLSVCQTKQAHDTEFEATIVAAKMENKYGEEFMIYKCHSHWHTCHADPAKRLGHGHDFARCPHCKNLFRKDKMYKHKCEVKERLHGQSNQGSTIPTTVQGFGSTEAAPSVFPLGQPSQQTEMEGF